MFRESDTWIGSDSQEESNENENNKMKGMIK